MPVILHVLLHDVLQYHASSAGHTAGLLCESLCYGEPGKHLRYRTLHTDSQVEAPAPCSPPATLEAPPSDLQVQTLGGTP